MTDLNTLDNRAFTLRPDSFSEFKESTPQKTQEAMVLLELVASSRPALYARLVNPAEPVKVTSLGAGDGAMELEFFSNIVKERKTSAGLSFHCVDPSEEMRSAFYERLKKTELGEMHVEYTQSRVEDPTLELPKGDLVIVSHALYYMDGWWRAIEGQENTVLKIKDSINKSGLGAFILQSGLGQMGYSLPTKTVY